MTPANPIQIDLAEVIVPIVRRYVRHFLGRSPEAITVQLGDGLIVVRLTGILTEAETRLYQADPSPAGQEIVEQVFRKLVRQTRDSLSSAIGSAAGLVVRAVLCDVDCASGDAFLLLVHDA